jgi:hypothetical protein
VRVLKLLIRLSPLLVAAVLAAPASAATTHRDSVVATVHRQSQSGATIVYTGTVRSTLFGRGTVRQVVRLRGLSATGAFTIRYAAGTITGSTSARGKPHLDGTATFTGSARITGGTGRYRGATGSGSYSGSGPLNLTKATFRQTGTVRY